jgi:hypothetical protein
MRSAVDAARPQDMTIDVHLNRFVLRDHPARAQYDRR